MIQTFPNFPLGGKKKNLAKSRSYLEDLDPHRVRQLLRVPLHLDVKGEDDRVLLLVLQHHRRLHHVALDHRTHFHTRVLVQKRGENQNWLLPAFASTYYIAHKSYWNFGSGEEVKQGLQRPQSGGLHEDAPVLDLERAQRRPVGTLHVLPQYVDLELNSVSKQVQL